jgi:hypothetical protein
MGPVFTYCTRSSRNLDLIELLQLICTFMYTGATSKDLAHALIDAIEQFHGFKQTGRMNNATYLTTFQSHIQAIDHLDSGFGIHAPYIQTRIRSAGMDPDDVTIRSRMQDEVKEEFIAKYFLLKSDPKRYASLIASIQNDFISSQDKYPKTLSKAYDMIVNYVNPHKQQGGVDLQEQWMSFYQDEDYGQRGRGRGRRIPGQGRGHGWGGRQQRGTPGQQMEDNDDKNYHLEEEYEEVIGREVNTANNHSDRLYPVVLSTSNMNTSPSPPTSAPTAAGSTHVHQYNLSQVLVNTCLQNSLS